MLTKFLLIIFILINVIECKNLTYGELAQHHLSKKINIFNNFLPDLSENSKPGDLSDLRISILDLRSYLDIFSYAFSIQTVDIFYLIRNDLNDGYTYIGNFDDLQNVHYTPEDMDKLLNKCLSFKNNYNNHSDRYNYDDYIKNPDLIHLYFRDKDKLSKDFWGNISYTPSENLSGYSNIGILLKGQIENLLTQYPIILNLDDVCQDDQHTIMHNFRKLLRSILYIIDDFPKVSNVDLSKNRKTINNVRSTLGKINDIINEYVYYTKKGQPSDDLKKQANDMFDKLKNNMENINLDKILLYIIQHLN